VENKNTLVVCPRCKRVVDKKHKYCAYCGFRLLEDDGTRRKIREPGIVFQKGYFLPSQFGILLKLSSKEGITFKSIDSEVHG
jgi:ribosomal protein L37E